MKYLDFLRLFFDEDESNGTNGEELTGEKSKGTEPEPKKGEKSTDKTYTQQEVDALVDKIVNAKFAKWAQKADKKADEAARLATMTAQERAEHERDALQKELNELKRAQTLAEMEKQARAILKDSNIIIDDQLVSVLVTEDADATSANVKSFITSFKDAVQDEVKKQLSHKKPATGSKNHMTKEEILKEPDMEKRQKLINQNLNLFKNR